MSVTEIAVVTGRSNQHLDTSTKFSPSPRDVWFRSSRLALHIMLNKWLITSERWVTIALLQLFPYIQDYCLMTPAVPGDVGIGTRGGADTKRAFHCDCKSNIGTQVSCETEPVRAPGVNMHACTEGDKVSRMAESAFA